MAEIVEGAFLRAETQRGHQVALDLRSLESAERPVVRRLGRRISTVVFEEVCACGVLGERARRRHGVQWASGWRGARDASPAAEDLIPQDYLSRGSNVAAKCHSLNLFIFRGTRMNEGTVKTLLNEIIFWLFFFSNRLSRLESVLLKGFWLVFHPLPVVSHPLSPNTISCQFEPWKVCRCPPPTSN